MNLCEIISFMYFCIEEDSCILHDRTKIKMDSGIIYNPLQLHQNWVVYMPSMHIFMHLYVVQEFRISRYHAETYQRKNGRSTSILNIGSNSDQDDIIFVGPTTGS